MNRGITSPNYEDLSGAGINPIDNVLYAAMSIEDTNVNAVFGYLARIDSASNDLNFGQGQLEVRCVCMKPRASFINLMFSQFLAKIPMSSAATVDQDGNFWFLNRRDDEIGQQIGVSFR